MKRDFKKDYNDNNNVEEITRGYFSKETLKEETPKTKTEQPREKRKYTKLTNKENKTHIITMRLTETEYNNLLAKANKSKSGTLTEYIKKQLEKGL